MEDITGWDVVLTGAEAQGDSFCRRVERVGICAGNMRDHGLEFFRVPHGGIYLLTAVSVDGVSHIERIDRSDRTERIYQ